MKRKRTAGFALGALICGSLLAAQPSCSAIVSDFKQQCQTTQDCVALQASLPKPTNGSPPAGLICSSQHVCVTNGCQSNLECQTANGGAPYICVSSTANGETTRTCQSLVLKSSAGDTVCNYLGDSKTLQSDDTIWIGASVYEATDTNQGLELVREDIDNLAQGLPPASGTTTARRPIGFVYCEADDGAIASAPNALEDGVKHLEEDLKLPVVITSVGTTDEIDVLERYSIPDKVFQLSTTAGGASILGVDNMGLLADLVFINPNYDKETTALVQSYLTPLLQQAGTLGATEQPRVAIINGSSATSASTAAAINAAVGAVVTGANVKDFSYGTSDNPTGTPAEYLSVVSGLLQFAPHIIITLGGSEIGPDPMSSSPGIDVPIEAQWAATVPNGQPPPRWIAILDSVGQLPKDMQTLDSAAQKDWGSRTLLVQQHYDFNGPLFTSYITQLQQYLNSHGGDPDGIAALEMTSPFNEFMREGAYLTAYSVALLAAQGQPVTGPNVAAAARSFGAQNAASFNIGQTDLFPALQSIASTKKPFNLVTFQGWTGFDAKGFATYTFADDVTCLTPMTDPMTNMVSVGALQPTGATFKTDGTLTGTISLTGCIMP